ncbi:MAG: glycerol-3-phosphate dehydrogenase/oxidase [bacterium]|nr:glycerol-3-phosphate dehydrogenase/oxidase [bacterium]
MSDLIQWPPGWREEAWARVTDPWDIVVIGGGITGAGIFAAGADMGMRILLLEQGDFASGTSSRSSKLVHGGLRYLKQGKFNLVRQSISERQRMLANAAGLVNPLSFLYTLYERDNIRPWMVNAGLAIYTSLFSGAGGYQSLRSSDVRDLRLSPDTRGLLRAFRYQDAQTDDARLVLRVISNGVATARGDAVALNYVKATNILKYGGTSRGAVVRDRESGREAEVPARVVINATGAWADRTRGHVEAPPLLRPLRGSHLFLDLASLPLVEAIAFTHPEDGRPVFAYPWEGVALVGTTDVDHRSPLHQEPSISDGEADYLLKAVRSMFPSYELPRAAIISSQAGVRPVVDTGKTDPSAESREHLVLAEQGLLTILGGKLTTFRVAAIEALRAAHALDSSLPRPRKDTQVLRATAEDYSIGKLEQVIQHRLIARYGLVPSAIRNNDPSALRLVSGTPYLWGELIWSASHEGIVHLSDLLLRRFRLGVLLRDGGLGLLPQLKQPVCSAMGWGESIWKQEVGRFTQELQDAHQLPFERESHA